MDAHKAQAKRTSIAKASSPARTMLQPHHSSAAGRPRLWLAELEGAHVLLKNVALQSTAL